MFCLSKAKMTHAFIAYKKRKWNNEEIHINNHSSRQKNFVIFHIFRFSRWPFWDYVTWDLQEGYLGKIGHWPICKNSHFYDPFKMSSPSIPGYWLIMSNQISAWAGDQVAGFRFITKYLASMMQRVDIKPKILILTVKILINPNFFSSVCFIQ